MVIALIPELETALKEQARQQGITPEALAMNALKERYLVPFGSIHLLDDGSASHNQCKVQ